MTFISSTPQHPHVLPRCRDRTPAAADDLAGPLAFSVTGLLTHGLALLTQGDDACLMLLNFALIASTPCQQRWPPPHFTGNRYSSSRRMRKT